MIFLCAPGREGYRRLPAQCAPTVRVEWGKRSTPHTGLGTTLRGVAPVENAPANRGRAGGEIERLPAFVRGDRRPERRQRATPRTALWQQEVDQDDFHKVCDTCCEQRCERKAPDNQNETEMKEMS